VEDTKYDGLRVSYCSKEVAVPYSLGVWKSTRKRWEDFYKFVSYEVGDGFTVRFWHDLWCGEKPLKFFFPKLFTIARCKDAWVVDYALPKWKHSLEYILYKTRAWLRSGCAL
jgi:hypothetical protein